MIKLSEVSDALKQAIIASTPNDLLIGFDNEIINPEGLNIYAESFFIPGVNTPIGKNQTDADIEDGVHQFSVYVLKNSGRYDIDQLKLIDDVKTYMRANQPDGVSISSMNTTGARYEGSWCVRDLSINWTAI